MKLGPFPSPLAPWQPAHSSFSLVRPRYRSRPRRTLSGEEAVQRYLQREIQNVYRSQRVEIDDKHLEIIIAQMLRKVRVDSLGDTGLLPGSVIDKFEFRRVNNELIGCVKVKDPGDTDYRVGDIVRPSDPSDGKRRLRVLDDAVVVRQTAHRHRVDDARSDGVRGNAELAVLERHGAREAQQTRLCR